MKRLNTAPNFATPGQRQLQDRKRGVECNSANVQVDHGRRGTHRKMINARLVLLLANHVGDLDVLREALALARRGVAGEATPP